MAWQCVGGGHWTPLHARAQDAQCAPACSAAARPKDRHPRLARLQALEGASAQGWGRCLLAPLQQAHSGAPRRRGGQVCSALRSRHRPALRARAEDKVQNLPFKKCNQFR